MPQTVPTELETLLAQSWTGFTWQRVAWLAVLFLCCLIAVKVAMLFLNKAVVRLRVESTLQSFILSLSRALLWFIALVVMLSSLGVSVPSLIALLSVIGLAVSLAIQGTLSNLAGGLMILVSKPFRVGDYVETGGVSGTVTGITLAYTKLVTPDRKVTLIPNSEISGNKIVNFSAEENRRVELTVSVDAAIPAARVRAVAMALLQDHPKTLFTPEPTVQVQGIKEGALHYVIRVWCANPDYWTVHFDLMERIQESFMREGLTITDGYSRIRTEREG